jgi:cystathionine beta-lyase/cystathionine gamma-synthase
VLDKCSLTSCSDHHAILLWSHSALVEHHIAKISSAQHAFAVSSGMAALDVILRLLKPGDEVIAGDDLYGGTNRLLTYLKTHVGVVVHHVDTTDPSLVLPFIKAGKTAMVLLESPTNPLLKIVDIATISKDVKERAPDAVVVVDNTMMSPYLQRPLEHGADIAYDSGTKYLSGHHDLMAGVITCNRDDLAKVYSPPFSAQ